MSEPLTVPAVIPPPLTSANPANPVLKTRWVGGGRVAVVVAHLLAELKVALVEHGQVGAHSCSLGFRV